MVIRILTAAYLLASFGSIFIGSKGSVIALGLFAALVTLPIFVTMFLRQILLVGIITALITGLTILIPPLGFLVAAWAVVSLVLKFARLARNLPPIVAGFGLYGLLLLLPTLLRFMNGAGLILEIPLMILLPVGATLMFHGILTMLTHIGYRPTVAASVMLGFPVYLTLFVLTFLLPGFGDVDLDGGDGGGF